MTMDEYKEMHGDDEDVVKKCHICGADYGKIYYMEGEYWCEDCLVSEYYCGDDDDFDEPVFCACCGEPVQGKVYKLEDGNGDDSYFCEECFFDAAEYGECVAE